MDVSKLLDSDPFRRLSALDSLAKQLADDSRWRLRMAEELSGTKSRQKMIADTQASLRLTQAIVPESLRQC